MMREIIAVVIYAVAFTQKPVFLSRISVARLTMTESMGGVFKPAQEKKLKKIDIVVIRIDKKDKENIQLVNARPCQNCLEMMKTIGIRRVYYSDDFGDIICENIKDMISIHSSKVMIKFDVYAKNKSEEINEDKYWDELIKNKIPDVVKEENFNNFITYDFKSLMTKYKLEPNKSKGVKTVKIINNNNRVIKSVYVV